MGPEGPQPSRSDAGQRGDVGEEEAEEGGLCVGGGNTLGLTRGPLGRSFPIAKHLLIAVASDMHERRIFLPTFRLVTP
jgi:hypothetical protein